MQIIACQFDIAWEDKSANHRKVRALLEQSSPPAGSLVVLPEMFSTGFSMKVARVAEGETRASERFLMNLATEFRVYLLGGVVNRAGNGRGLNQCLCFAPDGSEIARYTKLHPFSYSKEDQYYDAGDAPLTFSWQGALVAPIICYDLRFPEIFRITASRGAMIYTVIANWPQARVAHWLALLRARAIENQAYVVGVNRCGDDPWLHYPGRSLIVDPRGEIVADASGGEGTISAAIDLEELSAYRREYPALADIRPEFLAP